MEYNHDERVLLEQISLGNTEAYSRLYTSYVPKVYRFIFPFSNQSKEDTEEVVQDVFLKIWARREKLIGLKSFQAYLFRMAKNQLIDHHKSRNSKLNLSDAKPAVERQVTGSAYDNFIYEEYCQTALEAINKLSPQRRRIFEMRTQQEMAIDEIAEKLNISRSAVKKQLYEAIDFIKQYLHKHNGWVILLLLSILNNLL